MASLRGGAHCVLCIAYRCTSSKPAQSGIAYCVLRILRTLLRIVHFDVQAGQLRVASRIAYYVLRIALLRIECCVLAL